MKAIIWASDKPHEQAIANAMIAGSRDWEKRDLSTFVDEAEGDIGAFIGLKSTKVLRAYRSAGKPCLVIDKGYSRMADGGEAGKTNYWRVAINATQPTNYLFRDPLPGDRWAILNRKYKHKLKARNERGSVVFYFASSQRYHYWHDLPEMNDYARSVIWQLRKRWDGEIMYCPKPQAFGRGKIEAIPGALLRNRRDRIKTLIGMGHAAVVHGSGAAVECILNGVPVICLGDAITKPISETSLDNVKNPYWPEPKEREQWAFNFAYSQWTPKEMASGACWRFQLSCLNRYNL
jgi:hypothetical protein